MLHRTQGFDVVHDGRAHIKAQDRWEIRRLDARIGALAFQRFDQAGFLPANVSARAAVQVDFQIVTAAKNTFPEEVFCARFRQRTVQDSRPLDKLAADVDVGQVDVVGVARDDHALDHLVRVFVKDLFVFECAWLRLIGIANQVNGLAAFAIHERPL